MNLQIPHIRIHVFLLFLAFSNIAVFPATAERVQACGSLDRAVVAIRLAQALYPDLKGKELSLQFSEGTGGPLSSPADVRTLLITVDKPQWRPSKGDGEGTTGSQIISLRSGDIELPMYLHFEFIDAKGGAALLCRPVVFRNDKMGDMMKKARDTINAHPEWTDSQEVEASTKLGMKFGPDKKDALLKLLPLRQLSVFYGPLRIKKATFSVTGNSIKAPGASFADLSWSIQVERTGSPRGDLTIFVEPFGGRIVGITN